jgi:hypothetical protein
VNKRFGWEPLKEREVFHDLGMDEKMILKYFFLKRLGEYRAGLCDSTQG